VLPPRGEAADLGVDPVGEDDDAVGPKEVRAAVFVAAEVVVEGVLDADVRPLELDEDQRQPVDEAEQVGAAVVELARDPELLGEEVLVGPVARSGAAPVDDLRPRLLGAAVVERDPDSHAVPQHLVEVAVGPDEAERRPVARDQLVRLVDRGSGEVWVQPLQSRPQRLGEEPLGVAVAAVVAVLAELLVVAVRPGPAEVFDDLS